MSFSQNPLDLNLGLPGQVAGDTTTCQPSFESIPGPIISNDSVIGNPATALIFANQLLTPRDQELLAKRPDYTTADESICLNIQVATSVTNLCHRLQAKVRENESLCLHISSLHKRRLQDSNARVDRLRKETKELKKENIEFKEENRRVSLIVSKYQTETKTKLDTLQAFGEQLNVEQKRLIANIPSSSNPKP